MTATISDATARGTRAAQLGLLVNTVHAGVTGVLVHMEPYEG